MITQQYLEEKANIPIRKGFSCWINKTIDYLGKSDQELSFEDAQEVVKFINASSSRVSKSYWVLRTDLSNDDIEKQLENYKECFIQASYSQSNRRNVAKNHLKKNKSRGYSGYVELDKKYYCRSQHECIVLLYLNKTLSSEYEIRMEEKIYYHDNYSYKPDFFIYKNNILEKIIEVKDKKPDDEKYSVFSSYFEQNGIEFIILDNTRNIIRHYPDIKKFVDNWKLSASIEKSMIGRNNPRYGAIISDETRKKMSDKAKKRFEDNNERRKSSERTKKMYEENPNLIKKILKTRAENLKKKNEIKQFEYDELQKYLDIHDPYEIRHCVICGDELNVRKSSDKIACSGKKNCIVTWKVHQGIIVRKPSQESIIKNIKSVINHAFNKIKKWCLDNITEDNISEIIKKAKSEGIINKNNRISLKSIIKYYGSFSEFMNIVGDKHAS